MPVLTSLLLLFLRKNGLKEIQEWLGHSDFSTTANRYSHLTSDTKKSTMASMVRSLGLGLENVTADKK
jgi:integrase